MVVILYERLCRRQSACFTLTSPLVLQPLSRQRRLVREESNSVPRFGVAIVAGLQALACEDRLSASVALTEWLGKLQAPWSVIVSNGRGDVIKMRDSLLRR